MNPYDDDTTPFVYFDPDPSCRVKIRKADNSVVSWSPPWIPRERVLVWAKEWERDTHYTWRAWVHCIEALEGARKALDTSREVR